MTPREAHRILLTNAILRVLDNKPVEYCAGGHRYVATPRPDKQLGKWLVSGNSYESYHWMADVVTKLVEAEMVSPCDEESLSRYEVV